MTNSTRAKPAGKSLRANDEGPTVGTVARQECKQDERLDFPRAIRPGQALRVIEGERNAAKCLAGLQGKQVDPDELALIVFMLYGAGLRGFCRVIEKALGVHHA